MGPFPRQTPNSTRQTVVIIELAAAMGGVQFSTLNLVRRLDEGLWQPIVVCPEEGDLTEACRRSGIPVHRVDYPAVFSTSFWVGRNARLPNPFAWLWNGWATLIAAQRLARFLRQAKPGLVVTKGLFSHFCGGLAAHQLGIPCIWHLQDFISERFWGIYPLVFGLVARWLPDRIIVDGASISRQLPCAVHDRVSIIHNGVDTHAFRPPLDGAGVRREFGVPEEALVIGNVARMTAWKGQHYLIEAFAQIAAAMPHVYLLFVGSPVFDHDTYQRRLLDLTAKLGLGERVKFAGYRHDLSQMMAAMDVFAFTSIEKDTSPLALLSAMSSGLPIVAFDIEGVRELGKTDEQFLLVPPGHIGALARSLTSLVSDEGLRGRLAASARRQAESEFSLDQHVSRMEEAFSAVGISIQSVFRENVPSNMQPANL